MREIDPQTEWGVLTATWEKGHPVKYPVETGEELRILRKIWENSRYAESEGMEEAYRRVEAALGDDGIYVPTLGSSPVQQLIESDMGLANSTTSCRITGPRWRI